MHLMCVFPSPKYSFFVSSTKTVLVNSVIMGKLCEEDVSMDFKYNHKKT